MSVAALKTAFCSSLPMLAGALLYCAAPLQAADWSISADMRERYQSFNHFNFNAVAGNDSREFGSRIYLKAEGDFGHGLGMFLQPQAVLIRRHSAAGSQYLSQADLLQAYVRYDVGHVSFRLGRQQLVYGDQRLLGHLDWKDVARAFDGIRGTYTAGPVSVDAFAVHPADLVAMTPDAVSPRGSSLVTWEDRTLAGIYGTYGHTPENGVDVYFINWRHGQQATTGKGRNLHTFGARLFGRKHGLDATAEVVFQRGAWESHVSQKASAYAFRAGYTFVFRDTRLGLEYDVSPGDDKTDPAIHKNFVFPFHTNHMHYGEMDFFSWANMRDLRLSLRTQPVAGLTLTVNVHFLALDKARGDWINVAGTGNVFAGAPGYTQTGAGTETDLKLVYSPAAIKGLKLVGLYGQFNPGDAVSERNAGRADIVRFGYLIARYIF